MNQSSLISPLCCKLLFYSEYLTTFIPPNLLLWLCCKPSRNTRTCTHYTKLMQPVRSSTEDQASPQHVLRRKPIKFPRSTSNSALWFRASNVSHRIPQRVVD